MADIFSGSELLEIAVEIEKNGRDFYNTLIEKSKNTEVREMFKYLSREEERHITVFKDMLGKIGNYKPASINAEDYYAYMNLLASEHVFTRKDKGKEFASKAATDIAAIDMGIGFEKDSIVFYQGMKKAVPHKEEKIVDEIISEEQEHLKQLLDFKKII